MIEVENLRQVIGRTYVALMGNLRDFAPRVPPVRVARLLSLVGSETQLANWISECQQPDGGWADVDETVWCTRALLTAGGFEVQVQRAINWLRTMRNEAGGWGLSNRDGPRIITTSLIATMLPVFRDRKAVEWLSYAWKKDLDESVRLTYKGGFALTALSACGAECPDGNLVTSTVHYLHGEQNDDGGFGPWKGHPIGSDPWSTGIVLVGLTSWPDKADPEVIERAADWLCRTQLESGLWPYHFIDEGSAYAYWGLSKALEYFRGRAG
ncbi:MAG: terpene cyclase/mutase family protein [Firmicutes bacterium]|nr:terpene cyclase/mutase family protein [Bacillota bacterium]